ncbi:MAG: aspartate kinase [SAR324 cluster bacterium]|uniref:Aspartokinase n=1 Tax=SAR324 cluster bacterium TaxID=2024889 RepID=A0A7X9ILV4_9DELT|nr:aspartate kinase [SAR324 cluster bacterium]
MDVVVKKFGGTSVGDFDRIKNVAKIVSEFKKNNPRTGVIVVVSAMAGETNKLIKMAKDIGNSSVPRELDVLLATGEQVSIALLAIALIDNGIPAQSLTAQQIKIKTDEHHTNATIQAIDAKRIKALLAQGIVPVVAGFQGVTDDGNITTLGRGGSDITAVAVAATVKAKACYIYTDVEGVYSADPRICAHAKRLNQISHEEMLELASLGAKVIHHRAVFFAMCYKVPLVVLSTFNPIVGTWIVKEEELMEKPVVAGITYRTDETKITVNGLGNGIESLNQIFKKLADEGIFIDMITQAGGQEGKVDLSFTVTDEYGTKATEIVQYCVDELCADDVRVEPDIAKISVVGIGMRYHAGIASRMFKILAQEEINIHMISTSEIKISVVIPRKYCEVAVRALHDEFIDEKPEISEDIS